MSSKPHVALSAAHVADDGVLHAGAKRFDKAEYDALIEWMRLVSPEHFRSVMADQMQAHLAEAAVVKLRAILATPKAAGD